MKHLVACLAATAALALPPATTALLPTQACDTLNKQALPMISAAFSPVAQALTPIFTAFCTDPSPAPPGSPTSA
jgi:hypothetical protein